MRRILHLGVAVVPYTYGKSHRTTGDIATILEARYGVVRTFVTLTQAPLREIFAKEAAKAVTATLTGKPNVPEPMQGALDRVARDFRKFILARGMDGTKGVPTLAARRGINHRLKHPYAKKNPERQSLFDTGLYIGSFKVWFDKSGAEDANDQ
jgi:hypothetical protein